MQCIHKRFCVLGTVFLFLFANFLIVSAAQAQNALFTVEGVTVDITSKSAVAAREEAFEKAQKDAFTILAGRLLGTETSDPARVPDVDTISTMIKDYEISNEQLSSVRYLATYTIRFDENAVRRFFQVSGQSERYVATSANPALVLPFYEYNGRRVLWSPYNAFMKAWSRAGNMDGLVPLSVPLGDIADVSDIGDDDALSYNNTKLGRMLQRYNASEAVILVAVPDATLARVKGEGDAAAGTLAVSIYRTDRGHPEQVEGFEIVANNNDTLRSVMDRAVRQVQNVLRDDWKRKLVSNAESGYAPDMQNAQDAGDYAYTYTPPVSGNVLRVRAPYKSLKQWADTRRALSRAYGVKSVSIVSVKPSEAYVDIRYDGDINRLALSLGQMDLQLDNIAGGQSMARAVHGNDSLTYYAREAQAVNAAGGADGAQYDLYLRRYRR